MSDTLKTWEEGYNRDRMFGDSLMKEVELVIGQFGIDYDKHEDRQKETDLHILESRWGMRIRDRKAHNVWPYDVSIRLVGAHGGRSEFEKIMQGEGQYMLYGFMSLTREEYMDWREGRSDIAPHLIDWVIVDFDAFRNFFNHMTPEFRNGYIRDRAYTHPAPDNVTCMYIDRREIPGFEVTCAANWTRVQLVTWIRGFNSKGV